MNRGFLMVQNQSTRILKYRIVDNEELFERITAGELPMLTHGDQTYSHGRHGGC